MKFASELPYPQIELQPNLAQAKMLMPLYSGNASELTAIMSYVFQSYICTKHPELSQALKNTAMVEMRHHNLLGCTIVNLGGYPIMGARTYWNGSFANYTLSPQKFLLQNIESEKATISNYERTILSIDNEGVKTLLERIILDEEMHIEVFKSLLDTLV